MKVDRHLLAAIAGNALEYYDIMLYGFFAVTLAPLFFPLDSKVASLMASFGTFAASFLMRPLGAALFGHLGDTLGRQKALLLSILFMTIPTAAIGLLPTYETIGVMAPIILILCRLLQGMCLGGEYSGAAIFIAEHKMSHKTGFRGSILCASGSIGGMIGTALGLIFTLSFMPSWGWRVPFLIGSLLGMIGYLLRAKIDETPIYKKLERAKLSSSFPLFDAIRESRRNFILNLFLAGAILVPFYLASIYMSSILLNQLKLSNASVMAINTLLMLIQTIMVLVMGRYSDIIGKRRLMKLAALSLTVIAFPVFMLLNSQSLPFILAGQLALCIVGPGVVAPMTGLMPSLFPAQFRYSGLALSTCVGAALLGGTTPLIATALVEMTQNNMAPAFYLAASGLIIFYTVSKLRVNDERTERAEMQKAFT